MVRLQPLALCPLIALVAACGSSTTVPLRAPDFALQDMNPTSASAGTAVSPRDYLGFTTAWYFGNAL
ncbi:MAG: hypothetical protein ACE5JG_08215 [Planctomycetota bacterium]